MAFVNAISQDTNKTVYTDNGALSYKSTLNHVLDFFSKSGALRDNLDEALDYFIKAYAEDKTLADKALFYCRDIREGQGERKIFKHILYWLATRHNEEFKANIKLIPEYGRWDDLYALIDTPLENDALEIMKQQFFEDLNKLEINDSEKVIPISLIGKWLKSENTSSEESQKLAKITRKYFGLNPKEYRQALSKLRTRIEIVEKYMCQNEWNKINYEHVPSKALKQYVRAFNEHDKQRYEEFIINVKKGKAKINAGTLYPYDIAKKYIGESERPNNDETLNELWKHLPNYFDSDENVMCVVDVSGSMYNYSKTITPITVAVSLGLYISERTKGPFKNHFITFSENPEFVEVIGNDLYEKIYNITMANWGYSTDLIKVFDLILNTALKHQLKQEELPTKLFIISDMQFNKAVNVDEKNTKTTFEVIDQMFKDNGYKRPELVFWNVHAKSDNPVQKDELGTYLVSGISPSILKNALKCKSMTPVDLMLDVLNSERYKEVV
jgi:hypothetical protein